MMKRKYLVPSLVGFAFAALTTSVAAQDKIKLKVATFVPAISFQVVHGSQVWMDEVTRLTNGRVEFEFYPAEQLGKAAKLMDLMRAGVIDVVEVAPAYVTDKLPLVGVIEMPGLVSNNCAASKVLRKMASPGGLIYESDLKPLKVRPLTFAVLSPYSLFTSNQRVTKVEDFSGLKLRVSGGVMALAAEAVGAVPVRMSSPDIYESLSRGTIDGVYFAGSSIKTGGHTPMIKYAAIGYGFGTPSVMVSISDKKLASLPKDVQDALIKAGPVADETFCKFMINEQESVHKEFAAGGMEINRITAEEKKRLNEAMGSIGPDWAKSLDARGKPGTKVLEEFTKSVLALEKAGQ